MFFSLFNLLLQILYMYKMHIFFIIEIPFHVTFSHYVFIICHKIGRFLVVSPFATLLEEHL